MRFTLTVLIVSIVYAGLVTGAVYLANAHPEIHWLFYGLFFTGYNVGAALVLNRAYP